MISNFINTNKLKSILLVFVCCFASCKKNESSEKPANEVLAQSATNSSVAVQLLSKCSSEECSTFVIKPQAQKKLLISSSPDKTTLDSSSQFYRVHISCGSPCSHDIFVDRQSGNDFGVFDDVIAVNEVNKKVAWINEEKLMITTLIKGDKAIEHKLALAPVAAAVSAIDSAWFEGNNFIVRYQSAPNFDLVTDTLSLNSASEKNETRINTNEFLKNLKVDLDGDEKMDSCFIVNLSTGLDDFNVSNPWGSDKITNQGFGLEIVLSKSKDKPWLLTGDFLKSPIWEDVTKWPAEIRAANKFEDSKEKIFPKGQFLLFPSEVGDDMGVYWNGQAFKGIWSSAGD